jgi:hypothetical protein
LPFSGAITLNVPWGTFCTLVIAGCSTLAGTVAYTLRLVSVAPLERFLSYKWAIAAKSNLKPVATKSSSVSIVSPALTTGSPHTGVISPSDSVDS